ncbi:unnamed protein product (macronuclear) [Paramecium tetraurelia]|uniref:Pentacotripeptide-repeat region of PRORP domain-containing protein n=1 Tax=Paramecium tetraurelia TaxID=5888 RepID=A0BW12_PARTE|nr:uncharacterized protein GSPATT00032581001 [Paramecium tetraurelia]CAK62729.1 unnamed protein product [Paramecium tetraurelia]|eukprot:XP_001430127.1 hypothetical protein (macronuclear) [Paramecium tetraurelia strain d4-2]
MILSTRILKCFSSEKKILRFIKTCSSPKEIYQIYHKNQEHFTPLLFLEALKHMNTSPVKKKFDLNDDAAFYDQLTEVFKQVPMQEKWRFYVQVAKIGRNKQIIKQYGNDLTCIRVKQIAILLWGYHKNGIKKPKLVIHLIDQLQQNLDSLVPVSEKPEDLQTPKEQLKSENQEDNEINQSDEDEHFLEQQLEEDLQSEKRVLKDFKFKFKDLVLIIWAIQDIKLDSSALLIYTFKLAINNFNNKELITNRSLILLLQATLNIKENKQISAYQKLVIQNLAEQDLSNEGLLQLLLLLRTLGQLQLSPEFAQKLAHIMLKNQEKSNQPFSSKFASIMIWNLNKLGITDTDIYNKLGLHLTKSNEFKAMDISQAILIYSLQQTKSPQYQQYQFILRSLISKANMIKLDPRSQSIIKESLEQYQPHLIKLQKK